MTAAHIGVLPETTLEQLGPAHAALGMNNHVFYHSIASPACPLIAEQARAAPAPRTARLPTPFNTF